MDMHEMDYIKKVILQNVKIDFFTVKEGQIEKVEPDFLSYVEVNPKILNHLEQYYRGKFHVEKIEADEATQRVGAQANDPSQAERQIIQPQEGKEKPKKSGRRYLMLDCDACKKPNRVHLNDNGKLSCMICGTEV